MGDGSRLAIAILVLFLAMVAFFFAFHPHGVANPDGSKINNPGDILKWMFSEFSGTVDGTSAPASTSAATSPGSPNTSVQSTDLTQPLGTNLGPGSLWQRHYSSKACQFSQV